MRPRGLAYHLTTLGSVLVLVSILTLAAAAIGMLAFEVVMQPGELEPPPAIWVTPYPTPGPSAR